MNLGSKRELKDPHSEAIPYSAESDIIVVGDTVGPERVYTVRVVSSGQERVAGLCTERERERAKCQRQSTTKGSRERGAVRTFS
jgi:hypothetical protein